MDITSVEKKRPVEDDVSVHCDKRLKQAEDFTEKTWKEDFVLIVENKRLHVTKAVLAHASPVFDRMFQAEFKEKNLAEQELPEKKVEDVIQFLHCIYPNPIDVSTENVYGILPLAEEYQVSYLKSKCEACMLGIITKNISSDELYNMLELASMYNMTGLLEMCIEVASEKTHKALESAEKKKAISPVVKCAILEKMVLKLQHANFLTVLHNYHKCQLKRSEKLHVDIEDYAQWDGKSLKFTVAVNKKRKCRFRLFDVSLELCLTIGSSYHLPISINKIGLDGSGCTLHVNGIVLIKNVMEQKEDFTLTFDKKIPGYGIGGGQNKDPSHLSNVKQGYIYNGKFDVEVHLLAQRYE
ncbi:uncharacterized protein LOC123525114 [Mercenaria mercenaria]|uniref:uncharacterized protein LOC123525114 n=1 Tax=Mercenaria mercenaria TaxID=6596 RepID=UPI00234EDEDD|nr:uncharacterized protein LOC123525114 [Mercenaria mercenaria]